METGYIVIFENDGYRYPSGLVHRTAEAAEKAGGQPDRKGKPVKVIEIEWDDAAASAPWTA
jgi:hypothetical protein